MLGHRRRLLLGALVAGAVVSASLHAQPLTRPAALVSRNIESGGFTTGTLDSTSRRDDENGAAPTLALQIDAGTWQTGAPSRKDAAPWWAPVASAVIPGSGQLALGQQRGVAYMVAELYLIVQTMTARRDWNLRRDEYISLAADVARRQFGGSLPVGSWEYYEAMQGLLAREGIESGIFDLVPGGAVDPETDGKTYNGGRWRIARETYWADPNSHPDPSSPEYQLALADYENTAIRDEYRWSWRDAGNSLNYYREVIATSNDLYQRSINMAGLVAMNHLASLIDAYVTIRIRRYGGVRAVGMSLDGIESGVRAVGDPAARRYRLTTAVRFVPAGR